MTTPPDQPTAHAPEADPEIHLTAFALGELDPASAEYAAVEARLESDVPMKAEVESIRDAAAELTAALAAEPAPEATALRTSELGPAPASASDSSMPPATAGDGVSLAPIPLRSWPRRLAVAASLAAVAALGVAVFWTVTEKSRLDRLPATAMDVRPVGEDESGLLNGSVTRVPSSGPATPTSPLELRVYDIRDLVPATPRFNDAPEFDLSTALSSTDDVGGGVGGGGSNLFADADGDAIASSEWRWRNGLNAAGAQPTTQPTAGEAGARPADQFALGRTAGTVWTENESDWRGTDTRNDNSTSFDSSKVMLQQKPSNEKLFALRRASESNQRTASKLVIEARQLQREMKYDESLKLLDRALFIEPDNFTAQLLSEVVEESKLAVDHKKINREFWLKQSSDRLENAGATVPYSELLRFPEDWPELSERQITGLDDLGKDSSANRETLLKLKKTVPISFDANPLESVVDYVRETTGADIFVDWTTLNDSGIEPETPISLTLSNVPADKALQFVLQSVSAQGFDQVGYAVIDGVVVISSLTDIAQVTAQEPNFVTEAYDRVEDNPFLTALDNPRSTFSIDVDTASYANVRRFLADGQLPPADAVRIEEMVNYFDYGYAPPLHAAGGGGGGKIPNDGAMATAGEPFAADVEVTAAPWSPQNRLVRIGLKGKEIATDDRPAANLVFLLDVSGSMKRPNKLPLVKAGMKKLVQALRMDDRIAIVVYAGASGLVLDSTSDHDAVLAAIDNLTPGGSTNGAAGIELAYEQATANHIPGGLNRVILCTDGDFNVGITDRGALTRLIEEKANAPETPTYLTVLGFGAGNLKDATMEELSNVGDGNYGYVDSPAEAEKLLAEQVNATLLTIAKDVKIQVEFNPAEVAAYRLIGYENRLLAQEDFNNDVIDAGDIGAGHTVTALYEIVPASVAPPADQHPPQEDTADVDPLKYQQPAQLSAAADSGELLTLKLRYKAPDAAKVQGTSKLLEFAVRDRGQTFDQADAEVQFATAVAGFGMLLRGSPHAGDLTWDALDEWAQEAAADWANKLGLLKPEQQRRVEFAKLVHQARTLADPQIEAVE